jgi:hypothetical protein
MTLLPLFVPLDFTPNLMNRLTYTVFGSLADRLIYSLSRRQ